MKEGTHTYSMLYCSIIWNFQKRQIYRDRNQMYSWDQRARVGVGIDWKLWGMLETSNIVEIDTQHSHSKTAGIYILSGYLQRVNLCHTDYILLKLLSNKKKDENCRIIVFIPIPSSITSLASLAATQVYRNLLRWDLHFGWALHSLLNSPKYLWICE